MYIYKVTNTINGKIYIGQSKYNDNSYLGSGVLIKQAVIEYGKSNFIKEILEECITQDHLNAREKYWISYLNSMNSNIGYNIARGGYSYVSSPIISEKISKTLKGKYVGKDSFRFGLKLTDLHKKLLSDSTKHKRSDETRKKISDAKAGVPFSDSHRKNISKSKLGKNLSEKCRKNIGLSLTGRKLSEDTINKLRNSNIDKKQKNSLVIIAKNIQTDSTVEFNNCSQASRYFSCTRQRVKDNKIKDWKITIKDDKIKCIG